MTNMVSKQLVASLTSYMQFTTYRVIIGDICDGLIIHEEELSLH